MANSGSFNTSAYNSRRLTFSWEVKSQNIANNTTTISWTLKGSGGGTTNYYISGNFKVKIDDVQRYYSSNRINLYNGTEVAKGEITLSHDSVGKKSFSAYAEAGIYTYAVNCSGSGSWDLPDIPRKATITSAPNFNDTANPTIKYSNPAGNNASTLQACISLTGATDDIAYRNISKTGTSYTFNLTDAERNVLRNASKNSKTLNVRFYVKTIIGDVTYLDYETKTMTIVSANPTISSITYKDTNSTTTSITGNNQIIIRNNSDLVINLATIKALKYATLKSVQVTLNGVTKTSTLSGTSVSSVNIDMNTVNLSQDANASIVVTDSRGNTTTYSKKITIENWENPTAIFSIHRENNFYSQTDILANCTYSSLNGKNSVSVWYEIEREDLGEKTLTGYLQDNVQQTFTLNNEYAWNMKFRVQDKLGNTIYTYVLSRGMPIFFVDRIKNSIGINCFPQDEKSLEVNGVNLEKNVMTRSLSAAITDLAVNTYTIIPLNLTNNAGSKLTATDDGGIKIGSGISKVLVSGMISFDTTNATSSKHLRIIKNSYSANNTLAWSWQTLVQGQPGNVEAMPVLADVKENDVIYMVYYTGNTNDKIGGNAYGGRTSLTVQVVQ